MITSNDNAHHSQSSIERQTETETETEMSRESDAKRWLERVSSSSSRPDLKGIAQAAWQGSNFSPLFLYGLRVSFVSHGRALCSIRVPPHLTDIEGNWQPGPIALLIDMVSAAAIMSCEDTIKVTVDLNISFFSPAKIGEEMEIEALVLQNKGKLTGAVVEVRKKADRNLVAVGRQWMTSSSARPFESKL
ncbi:Acyl-coenzyme A thioesterase 13 [Rhynchospora pubera]|uniref:Acyl-coenzyme A thioesterase 13 n=1 Tax=Rhynchospora pubera TaxID=906938 RepID=A0AAV8CSB7_9POAL|nr:Acyl-coenzyme A thioesterase 13 [Rhynchospora pubera]